MWVFIFVLNLIISIAFVTYFLFCVDSRRFGDVGERRALLVQRRCCSTARCPEFRWVFQSFLLRGVMFYPTKFYVLYVYVSDDTASYRDHCSVGRSRSYDGRALRPTDAAPSGVRACRSLSESFQLTNVFFPLPNCIYDVCIFLVNMHITLPPN